MREFSIRIDEHLINGLRPKERLPHGAKFMYQCQNAIPRAEGMELYKGLTSPFTVSPTVTYPFPQLFRGTEVTLLCFENTIYTVTETAGAWTYDLITTYDYTVHANTQNIATGGGIWQFVDFGEDAWFLYNGKEIVFKSRYPEFEGDGVASRVYVVDDIAIGTGCMHMGRNVIGGLDAAKFWNADWQTFFDYWLAKVATVNSDIPLDVTVTLDSNYVFWTSVGGGETLSLFYPDISIKGITEEFSQTEPLLLRMLERNSCGFMPMPTKGNVLLVKPLGSHVIVYSSDGIASLDFILSPVPTYGASVIADFGIEERGAVGGDENNHLIVDKSGEVFTLDKDLKLERLDYKEYIGGMVGNSLLVNQDPLSKDFYISSDTNCYLLTDKGLGQAREVVTSVHMAEGDLIGISKDIAGDNRGDFLIASHTEDMKYRGMKMIQGVEVAINTEDPVYVAIDYRHSKADTYTRSSFILLNLEGMAMIPVSGIDFRFVIKVPYVDATNWYVEPDYILVHWKAIDKRFKRGLANVS